MSLDMASPIRGLPYIFTCVSRTQRGLNQQYSWHYRQHHVLAANVPRYIQGLNHRHEKRCNVHLDALFCSMTCPVFATGLQVTHIPM